MQFALIGAAGYIAPKHYEAIAATGGTLVAAMDLHDSVGILDRYFPHCRFFTEYERFERYLHKCPPDYLVVCTPNYLHDVHCRLGLNVGSSVICEKPLTVNTWNAESLEGKVNVILQMRLHPVVEQIRQGIEKQNEVQIEYVTPRGHWYDVSWKGDETKSGGLVYNIGIHVLDLCCHLFGEHESVVVYDHNVHQMMAAIQFPQTKVRISLSLRGEGPQRRFVLNGQEYDLTNGFTDLHVASYERILEGRGWTVQDALPAIRLATELRCFMKQPS